MRHKANQLQAALQKKLADVYFISGDEPAQQLEAADAVRSAAKQAGFLHREILTVDENFSWNQFSFAAESLSLFAEKKLIDLRISTGKLGQEGSKVVTQYCKKLPPDTLLLMTAAKIDKASQKSRWFQALDSVGVSVQVWNLEGNELKYWLQQRLQKRGIQLEPQALSLFIGRIEGNLLAAQQEIEKLYILYGSTNISLQQLEEATVDNSRYDIFKLTESALMAKPARITKILKGLQAEGIATVLVLWALTREARLLNTLKLALSQGQPLEPVFKKNQVWGERKNLVNTSLKRLSQLQIQKIIQLSSQADRQIKGQQSGDVWETLLFISLLMAGVKITA